VTATLTPEQVALLEGQNFAVVATVDERGRPHSTVVWIDTDGTDVLFNTTTVRAKARHLRANPYASVVVIDRNDFYRWVEIEGPVETTEEGAAEHIDKLSNKYDGQDFSNHDNRLIVRLHPERVVQYHD
jgi:PPOX class probable F420-dependent enzyme